MELVKHGHACVVLADGDRRIVIDPGVFTIRPPSRAPTRCW